MKLSFGILSYTLNEELRGLTMAAIKSYPGVDELIVVENGGQGDYPADVFVRLQKNEDYYGGLNAILRIARGDFIALVNNDTALLAGNLYDLCIADTVTSPLEEGRTLDGLNGSFFVVPRTVLLRTGGLEEIYGSDTRYSEKIQSLGIPFQRVDSVVISHKRAKTMSIL